MSGVDNHKSNNSLDKFTLDKYTLNKFTLDDIINSDEYEKINIKLDPIVSMFTKSIDIIKKFIIENKLILYGGTAIDYALRLRGDKIYDDASLELPDLDFYSYDNVMHGSQLADILFKQGFKEVRMIRAKHYLTMRIDIGNMRFAADISYMPKEIFDNMVTVEYQGMKCAHPNIQRIDLNHALSHPFMNPPMEVIFQRWHKDIKRLGKLDAAYPVCEKYGCKSNSLTPALPSHKLTIFDKFKSYCLHGFAAYSILYTEYSHLLNTVKAFESLEELAPVIPAEFKIENDGSISYSTIHDTVEILTDSPDKVSGEFGFSKCEKLKHTMEMIPGVTLCELKKYSVAFIDITGNMVAVNKYRDITYSNIHFLLKYFAACGFLTTFRQVYRSDTITKSSKSLKSLKPHKDLSRTYYQYYQSCMNIQKNADILINKLRKHKSGEFADEMIKVSPFFPTVNVYDTPNIPADYTAIINMLKYDIGEASEPVNLPHNYYPSRGHPIKSFDYEASEYF